MFGEKEWRAFFAVVRYVSVKALTAEKEAQLTLMLSGNDVENISQILAMDGPTLRDYTDMPGYWAKMVKEAAQALCCHKRVDEWSFEGKKEFVGWSEGMGDRAAAWSRLVDEAQERERRGLEVKLLTYSRGVLDKGGIYNSKHARRLMARG